MKKDLFICHDWEYSFEYNGICQLLSRQNAFLWNNLSIPEHDPLEQDEYLKYNLRNQIRPASVVIVPAAMYIVGSSWMKWEIKFARRIGKPILGVAPFGARKLPKLVQNAAWKIVGWRANSIASAIIKMTEIY